MNQLVLIAVLGGQRVAFPADQVEAVVELEALTPVPGAPAHVVGLAALRSRVLTVLDPLLTAAETAGDLTSPRDAIVVHLEGHPYAPLVDGVEDVLETSGETAPLKARLTSAWARVGLGTVEVGGDLLLLVDIAALVAGPAAEAA